MKGHRGVPKPNMVVSLLKTKAAIPASRLFQYHAAGPAELPATLFRVGSFGARVRRGGLRQWQADAGRLYLGRDLSRPKRGRPITRLIHHAPHPLKPKVGATRTAPASARRFKPGPILKA